MSNLRRHPGGGPFRRSNVFATVDISLAEKFLTPFRFDTSPRLPLTFRQDARRLTVGCTPKGISARYIFARIKRHSRQQRLASAAPGAGRSLSDEPEC